MTKEAYIVTVHWLVDFCWNVTSSKSFDLLMDTHTLNRQESLMCKAHSTLKGISCLLVFRDKPAHSESVGNNLQLHVAFLLTRSCGGVVVKLLACEARGPGFDFWSRCYDFRDW